MDRTELDRLEAVAEQAYGLIYDTPPMRSAKDAYDDAQYAFRRAINEAGRLGLPDEAERLRRRRDHVEAVWNHQFRGL